MGSHAKLSLGSLGLGTTKNGIDPELMWLFRPSDRHTEIVDRHGPTSLAKYINAEHIDDYDESNPLLTVEYRCSAVAARDRLEIKGFTYEIAQASFMGGLRNTIDLYQSIASGRHTSQASPYFEEKLRLLRSLTLRVWLEAFARIKEEHLTKEALDELRSDDYQLPLLRHMLESSQDFYGFPGFDYRLAVRTILEVASPQDCLIYDLSDLVAGGWIEEASEFVALTEHSMNTDFLLFHRVIVLTEGDTDRGRGGMLLNVANCYRVFRGRSPDDPVHKSETAWSFRTIRARKRPGGAHYLSFGAHRGAPAAAVHSPRP